MTGPLMTLFNINKIDIVALDVDGILANPVKAIIRDYNRDFGTNITEKEIKNWDFSPGITDSQYPLNKFTEYKFWTNRVYPYRHAYVLVHKLWLIFREKLVLVSVIPNRESESDKRNWIATHIAKDMAERAILVCDKREEIHENMVLIDDSPINLAYAESVGAIPICYNRPWNQETSNPSWTGTRAMDNDHLLKICEENV